MEHIIKKFRVMIDRGKYRTSPLYSTILEQVIDDAEVLALFKDVDPTKQINNLMFGSVHYLLLKGIAHPLARYYPTLTTDPEAAEGVYPDFRAFCLEHADEIREIAHTRYVQVNEVGRCRSLVPGFQVVSEMAQGRPLAVFELGTSAGLLLHWDRYHYDYGFRQLGPASASVRLACEIQGALRPPIQASFPPIAARVGMDIVPVDLDDPDAVLWLQAVVWPDQPERAQRLNNAIAIARENPVPVMQGDAYTDVVAGVEALPAAAPLCIFYAGLLTAVREAAQQQIAEIATTREVYLLGLLGLDLILIDYNSGAANRRTLARVGGLGDTIEWRDADTSLRD
jgi:hypothetical protein